MKFFELRQARKELKDVLHHARHIRNMHEDIAAPKALEELRAAEQAARSAQNGREGERMKTTGEAVDKACEKVAPQKKHPKLRENVEVLFVSIAAAMAIRAYFFQPIKIPTGSMQPTLYGITVQAEPTIKADNPLANFASLIFFGERRQVIRAKTSGYLRLKQSLHGFQEIDLQTSQSATSHLVYIDDVAHRIPDHMLLANRDRLISLMGRKINKGDVLAEVNGVIKSGDYILVNRIKYNFFRPKRGDIAVFDTRELTHPQVRKDNYYIKRMVGLPGEEISINPPYLLVNGKKPADPRFDKIFNDDNYDGYVFGSLNINPVLISKAGDSIHTEDDEYLFFGDNTTMSLDGRYFGPVNRRDILGPAFFVCWPLDRAGFAETSH
jgi:signal peptidase I